MSVREPIRRRQPVERPIDIVGLELLVSVSQALLAGILLSLAVQLGGDARAEGLPVPGLLAVLGVTVGVGWMWWLVGGAGWVMSAVCFAVAILTGALWLLSLSAPDLPRIDPLVGLIAVACAIYGIAAGVFLPGPRREHWKGGISQPKRGLPQTRTTPARFSPPVQRVVDERLSNVTVPRVAMPRITLPAARSITLPSLKRLSGSPTTTPDAPADDGLAAAPDVPPQGPPEAHPPGDAPDQSAGRAGDPAPASVAIPVETPPAPVSDAGVPEDDHEAEPAAPPPDPDAPTQPVERGPSSWPRPIDPHGGGSGPNAP